MCNKMNRIGVLYVSCTPTITISLASIESQTTVLFTGAAETLSFTATDSTSGACGSIEYSLVYTPASVTPSLISLASTTSTDVNFKASSSPGDANVYTVTVKARLVG